LVAVRTQSLVGDDKDVGLGVVMAVDLDTIDSFEDRSINPSQLMGERSSVRPALTGGSEMGELWSEKAN